MRLRLLAACAVVAAAVSGLAACAPQAEVQPAPDRTPVVAGAPAGFEDYYGQEISWEECAGAGEGTFYCATLAAPQDWSDPDAGDIELAIIVHPAAASASRGSLLVNPGGPGASGVDLIQQSAEFAVGPSLLREYDVVGFDPRGVSRSTPVRCLDDGAMDAYLFDIPDDPRGSPQRTAELTASTREFARACETNSGDILAHITTADAARDLDLLRGVLGDEKLNYLGYSYGSFLGATFAELFPERVGRVVLDGGIDPSVPGSVVGARQAVGFQSALEAYLAYCVDTPEECPFDGPVDTALGQVGDALAAVDEAPLEASDGRFLGADALMLGIISALYSEGNWPFLSAALAAALGGDPDPVFRLVDNYYNRSGGTYLDNSTEAFTAYNCMDYPLDPPHVVEEARAIVEDQAPTFAPYWSSDVDTCEAWPHPPTGTRGEIRADGADPILLIGTTNDPATPYEWSAALAEQMSSGILLTRVGEGHLGFNKGNACIDDVVVDYFVDGTVPDGDVTCD